MQGLTEQGGKKPLAARWGKCTGRGTETKVCPYLFGTISGCHGDDSTGSNRRFHSAGRTDGCDYDYFNCAAQCHSWIFYRNIEQKKHWKHYGK